LWEKRSNRQHRGAVDKIKQCRTPTKQSELELSFGCRYSSLLELPYFDAPRMLCIDPMHNLFLGTGKRMLSIWIKDDWISKSNF
jgi:hypothetical protein